MTSRELTSLRSLAPTPDDLARGDAVDHRLHRLFYGAIGWPFLLFSLWGGTKASKRRLLQRIGLADDALPHLGSWKADTGFLHRIVDAVELLRPQVVVELGCGASSLVAARALELHGGGRLVSYDQHGPFVAATREWLAGEGVDATIHHAPLRNGAGGKWPGSWYDLTAVPEQIDLIIIDGPPWTVHPFVRGAAEQLFSRLRPGGMVLLDDAARPGERIVARRWRRNWPDMRFARVGGSTAGTLVGRKAADVIPLPQRTVAPLAAVRRVAAAAALLAGGWLLNETAESVTAPVQAASFIADADASFSASLMRQQMASQPESVLLDRAELQRATGLTLPTLPAGWQVRDVQLYPSNSGMAVTAVLLTQDAETVALFATRAETPAEKLPLLARRAARSVAYWEEGPFAYALTGELPADRMLRLSAALASRPEQQASAARP
ncbi:class I SAM-dependent methyltransferase [Croceibacterium sp. TMG7-5b_MA50]|uniref:class I SAM-dependent methyltransferase n=1 Tax=Croceibacterium sp. TMG7-5b_MA50 TaxID=3121290 RepID=UPI003221F4CB